MCRSAVSASGEACVILLTFPHADFGYSAKRAWQLCTGISAEDTLARYLTQAMFAFLRFREGLVDFDINDPVPADDDKYGIPNNDVYIIFNAARDDPDFQLSKLKYDIVTDGNYQGCRKLCDDEKHLKHNPVGRPMGTNKSFKAAPKPNATSQSRCAAVRNVEKITPRKLRTGGFFASMNMKSKKQ